MREIANKERIPPPEAADSKWPVFPLSEELEMSSVGVCTSASIAAATSIGSPRAVPVPCASKRVVRPFETSDRTAQIN